MFVTDAVGGQSGRTSDRDRTPDVPASQTRPSPRYCELFRDWASPKMPKAREAICWYFGEAMKMGADVGISDVEKEVVKTGGHT